MPKDATKNVDRYKIRGGSLNEYEFHENQQQTAKNKDTDKRNKKKVKESAASKKSKK